MMIYIVVYFITFSVVLQLKKKARLKTCNFPSMKMMRDGLKFFSTSKHKIKIDNAKVMQVDKNVYLKKDKKIVQIKNVDNIFVEEGCLYFTALGNVKIILDLSDIYNYFNLKIYTNRIDIEKFKKIALFDIKNNVFDCKNSIFLKKYLKILKNILNINLENNKITIKQNKFKIAFCVEYKTKNGKKRIKVNC